MTVEVKDIDRVLAPGVKGLLSPLQANNLVLRLIIVATDPISSDALRYLARFLTHTEYDELIEERTVLSRCGYPTCSLMLRDGRGNVRSPRNQTVLKWQHHFCQLGCYQASQFYREQLSLEPLVTRKNVAFSKFGDLEYENDVLLLPVVKEIAASSNKTVTEVMAEMIRNNHLSERLQELTIAHEEQIEELQRLQIKERNT